MCPPADTPANADISRDTSIWDQLLRGARSAVELRVTTIVADIVVSGDLKQPTVTIPKDTSHALATSINLVDGDITNAIPKEFWSRENAAIREFHQQQVEQASEIVARNIRLICDVGSKLAEVLSDLRRLESDNS